MSPLAFDKQGKPFSWNRRTRQLLVRVFKNPSARGTCCQVLDAEGNPLYVDAETDYVTFRKIVGNGPGLYRLDQCDDEGNELEDAQPAYVSIDITRNVTSSSDGDVNPLVIVEHMFAIHADVMKTMAAQQANIMAASAELLRAPLRLPPPAAPPREDHESGTSEHDDNDEADGDDDADEADEADDTEPAQDPWASLRPLLDMVEPHLPKLGAFLYEQFVAFLKKSATAPAAAPALSTAPASAAATPVPSPDVVQAGAVAGSSAQSSVNAPAPPTTNVEFSVSSTTGASAARRSPLSMVESDSATSSLRAPSANEPAAEAQPASAERADRETAAEQTMTPTPAIVTSTAARRSDTTSATTKPRTLAPNASASAGAAPGAASTSAAPQPRNALPEPTAEQVAHLLQVRERLSPKERAIAENAISRMTPDMLVQWLAELSAMSVDEAARTIRQMIDTLPGSRSGGGE